MSTVIGSNRRQAMLAVSWAAGIIYAVLAARWYVQHEIDLVPLMSRYDFFRASWYAIQLLPVTIVVAALRVRVTQALLAVAFVELVMMLATWMFSDWNIGELLGSLMVFTWNLALQVPVWLLTFGAATVIRRAMSDSS